MSGLRSQVPVLRSLVTGLSSQVKNKEKSHFYVIKQLSAFVDTLINWIVPEEHWSTETASVVSLPQTHRYLHHSPLSTHEIILVQGLPRRPFQALVHCAVLSAPPDGMLLKWIGKLLWFPRKKKYKLKEKKYIFQITRRNKWSHNSRKQNRKIYLKGFTQF